MSLKRSYWHEFQVFKFLRDPGTEAVVGSSKAFSWWTRICVTGFQQKCLHPSKSCVASFAVSVAALGKITFQYHCKDKLKSQSHVVWGWLWCCSLLATGPLVSTVFTKENPVLVFCSSLEHLYFSNDQRLLMLPLSARLLNIPNFH